MNSDKYESNHVMRISDPRARRLGIRSGYAICCLGFLVLFTIPASADSWTNAAGHGVEARLVSLKKDVVSLQRGKGRPFKMKLSSFCATDQKRIRKHFGLKAVAVKPSATDLAYEKQLARLRELLQ